MKFVFNCFFLSSVLLVKRVGLVQNQIICVDLHDGVKNNSSTVCRITVNASMEEMKQANERREMWPESSRLRRVR